MTRCYYWPKRRRCN